MRCKYNKAASVEIHNILNVTVNNVLLKYSEFQENTFLKYRKFHSEQYAIPFTLIKINLRLHDKYKIKGFLHQIKGRN